MVGVPHLPVKTVPRPVGIGLVRGLTAQTARSAAVDGVLHGQHGPQLSRPPAPGLRQAFAECRLEIADALFERAVVLGVVNRLFRGMFVRRLWVSPFHSQRASRLGVGPGSLATRVVAVRFPAM